jgi:hypothetical protein
MQEPEFGVKKIFRRGVIHCDRISFAEVVTLPEKKSKLFVNISGGYGRLKGVGLKGHFSAQVDRYGKPFGEILFP